MTRINAIGLLLLSLHFCREAIIIYNIKVDGEANSNLESRQNKYFKEGWISMDNCAKCTCNSAYRFTWPSS